MRGRLRKCKNPPPSRAATVTSMRKLPPKRSWWGGTDNRRGLEGSPPHLSAALRGERRARAARPAPAAQARPPPRERGAHASPSNRRPGAGQGIRRGRPVSPSAAPQQREEAVPGLTRHLSREEPRSSAPRPVPAAAAGMGLCGRGWARCAGLRLPGGSGPLWALPLSRALPLRPCRTGGWAPPRPEGKAGYGLWAGGRALAPRGARGLRSSNPFTRGQEEEWRRRNRSALAYIAAAAVGMVGMSYAAVPLYRLYCQVRRSPAAPSRSLERAGAAPSPPFPSHRPRAWAERRAPGTARSRSSA